MANSLTQKIKHSQVEIIFFNFTVTDLKIVKQWDDHTLYFFFMIEVQMIGIGIYKRNYSTKTLLPRYG